MNFWQVFAIFSILAAVFILWPLASKQRFSGRGKHAGSARAAGTRARLAIWLCAIAIPVASLFYYFPSGAKADWEITETLDNLHNQEEVSEKDRERMLTKVRKRARERPNNGRLWFTLGSLESQAGNYEEAVMVYRHLKSTYPDSPIVIAELAQALFLRAGNSITPEVRENTQLALSMDPNLPTALGLAGIDAFHKKDYKEAINVWTRAVQRLNPESSAYAMLSQGIVQAQLASERVKPETEANAKAGKPAASGKALTVKVKLAESLPQLPPETRVFVYARAWQGPKMPLAIQTLSLGQLPKEVRLDSSMAMTQSMTIETVSQLEIVARISLSGGAAPQSGDWIASVGPVVLDSKEAELELTIDTQIP